LYLDNGIVGFVSASPQPSVEELCRLIAELRAVNTQLREVVASQAARIEELERRLGRDSSNSQKPPSSDAIFGKRRDRSSRPVGVRQPGKQPGAGSATMRLVDNPDQRAECSPPACVSCGGDLTDAPVTGRQRRQVSEGQAPPPPKVTEYEIQAKTCTGCGAVSVGQAPAYASGRAQYGPDTHAVGLQYSGGVRDQEVRVDPSVVIVTRRCGIR
jgi:transposase